MQRKSFEDMECPIARSLDRIGEWWSILIIRDSLFGLRRFDEFQKNLGISPNMLTKRLQALVNTGMLIKQQYSEHPPRYEYLPTAQANDFRPILLALMAWGNRHCPPENVDVRLIDRTTGKEVEPVMMDAETGKLISSQQHIVKRNSR